MPVFLKNLRVKERSQQRTDCLCEEDAHDSHHSYAPAQLPGTPLQKRARVLLVMLQSCRVSGRSLHRQQALLQVHHRGPALHLPFSQAYPPGGRARTRCTAPPLPATAACPGWRPSPGGQSRGRQLHASCPELESISFTKRQGIAQRLPAAQSACGWWPASKRGTREQQSTTSCLTAALGVTQRQSDSNSTQPGRPRTKRRIQMRRSLSPGVPDSVQLLQQGAAGQHW